MLGLRPAICLDILQSFGSDCDKGLEEMRQEVLRIKHSMLNIPLSSLERAEVLRQVCKWDRDHMWTTRQCMLDISLLPRRDGLLFQFVRYNPMYCGLLIHDMRTIVHYYGSRYVATPGTLVGLMQLYNTMCQENLLPDDMAWEDLETLWEIQGDASFFVGSPSITLKDSFTSYCLSIGTSFLNLASHRRKGTVQIANANNRKMMLLASVPKGKPAPP